MVNNKKVDDFCREFVFIPVEGHVRGRGIVAFALHFYDFPSIRDYQDKHEDPSDHVIGTLNSHNQEDYNQVIDLIDYFFVEVLLENREVVHCLTVTQETTDDPGDTRDHVHMDWTGVLFVDRTSQNIPLTVCIVPDYGACCT